MISLSRLRRELAWPPDQETELGELRASLVALWEERTGRLWAERADHVEELRPLTEESELMRLELWPVSAITKVEVRARGASEWEELAAADYLLDQPNRLVRVGDCWEPFVRVTYDGGYAEDAAPGDVLTALILQAKFMSARHGADKIAVRGASVQGGGATFMEDAWLHPTFKKSALARRRRV